MKELVVLNYQQTLQTAVTAQDIPDTIPATALTELLKDDPNPFYSVEAIKYPVIGNTHLWGVPGVYEEGYFNSLAEALKARTIPGSKDGHSDSSKPANDLFVTGMKVASNGDGSGTAYFKIYIPPRGFITDNQGVIRDAKLGLLRFSLVSSPVYDQQKLASSNEYHIIGTKGGDRNDAVEEGAMSQTVNAKAGACHAVRVADPAKFDQDTFATKVIDKSTGILAVTGKLKGEKDATIQSYLIPKDSYTAAEAKQWLKDHDVNYTAFEAAKNESENVDFELAMALASNGQCTREDTDGEVIQNGRVSYPVLRRMVSHADCANKEKIASIISIVDKKTNGGKTVDAKEVTGYIKNGLANNTISVLDIAKESGFADMIRNSEDAKNAETIKALNALNLGDDPVAKVKAMLAENAANADAVVKNKIVATYGVAEKEIAGKKTENTAHAYAYGKCKGLSGTELETAFNSLKDDPIMKAIRGNQADPFMQVIDAQNSATESAKTIGGIPVVTI